MPHALTPRSAPSPRLRARRGVSLAELIVAMTILSIIMGSVLVVLVRQQRLATSVNAMAAMRAQLQQANTILPMDLRALSATATKPSGAGGIGAAGTADPDVRVADDTAITVRVNIGSGVACAIGGDRRTITIAPNATLASGVKLSGWETQPQPGDTVLVLDEGTTASTADDGWRPYTLRPTDGFAQGNSNGCPTTATGAGMLVTVPALVTSSDAGLKSYTAILPSTEQLPASVATGLPMRFMRNVKYAMYRAADNKFYLGYCEGTACNAPSTYSPIAGPVRDYVSAGNGANGVAFTYYDSTGTKLTLPITNRANIVRVDVTLRTSAANVTELGNAKRSTKYDSTRVSIAFRNR